MSLRVGWNEAPSPNDCHDVTMQDVSPSWTPHGAVLRAGRDLSAWIFGAVSSPCSPSFPVPKEFSSTNAQSWDHATAPRPSSSTLLPLRIHDLPWEIMQEIFQEYLRSSPRSNQPLEPLPGSYRRIRTHFEAKTTPILLGHVCSSWRSIVMTTPALWSRLFIFCPDFHDLPLLEFWLARSGAAQLDLTFVDGYLRDEDPSESPASLLLPMTLQHSSRWRSADLRLGRTTESLVQQLLSLDVASLRHFEMHLRDWSQEGTDHLFHLLSSGTSVRAIRWGEDCHPPIIVEGDPWSNLTHLKLGMIDSAYLLSSLPVLNSLETLEIDILDKTRAFASAVPHPTILRLPRLVNLSINRYADIRPLLENLLVPSLTSLDLGCGLGRKSIPVESGCDILGRLSYRSGCCISSLQWSNFDLDGASLVQHLATLSKAALPGIRSLVIKSPVNEDAIKGLENQVSTFPLLSSLVLANCTASVPSLQSLAISRSSLQWLVVNIGCERHVIRSTRRQESREELLEWKTPYSCWF